MKDFMSGCDAIARGAWEGRVDVVSSYPGSPVTQIVSAAERYQDIKTLWATNEKVAMETAIGVSHAGGRALVVLKHVGLNVAADPFFNVAYTGVKGGLVVVVGDDPGAKSSQNEQDSRLTAISANVPVLEPASLQEAYLFTKLAFEISETFDVPVLVRITSQHCYSNDRVITGSRSQRTRTLDFARPVQKYLLVPDFVVKRHEVLVKNLDDLQASDWSSWLSETRLRSSPGQAKHPFGIICTGYLYNLVREILGDDTEIPVMKLGLVFPIDKTNVMHFAEHCETLLVIEDSSRALEQQVRSLGINTAPRHLFLGTGEIKLNDLKCDALPDWNARIDRKVTTHNKPDLFIPVETLDTCDSESITAQISIPKRPAGFCAGCSHSPIFHQLSARDIYVVGDIGCYTLGATQPFSALHANLCMGASIGILQGYLAVMDDNARKNAVAVIGDSTFFHSGIPPLLTAVNRKISATILVLDNSRSAMTGYQQTYAPRSVNQWLTLLAGLGVPEFEVVDALSVNEISTTLDRFLLSDTLSVMVVKGDCVQGLPHHEPTNFRYVIREDLCTSCGKCLETDCPSITQSLVDEKAVFEITNECIGCGFCSQTCPEKAIIPMTVSFESKSLTKVMSKVPWHRVIRMLRSTPIVKDVLPKFEKAMY